jgi:matrix metalloproteinase-14 (membrane-inserted)
VLKLDAAFVWGKNGRIYLFSGERYWKLTSDGLNVEQGYPQSIAKRWRGIPDNIEAAFTWRNGEWFLHSGSNSDFLLLFLFQLGETYFFKANSFWRFDEENVIADERNAKTVSKYWFGCQN